MKKLDWKEFFENDSNWDWEQDNSHYVSKFILRQFVPKGDKSGKLVVYDKEEERFRSYHPKRLPRRKGSTLLAWRRNWPNSKTRQLRSCDANSPSQLT